MYSMQVGGALLGFAVERISVGMQHVAAQANPLDKKTGLPQVSLYRPLNRKKNGKKRLHFAAVTRAEGVSLAIYRAAHKQSFNHLLQLSLRSSLLDAKQALCNCAAICVCLMQVSACADRDSGAQAIATKMLMLQERMLAWPVLKRKDACLLCCIFGLGSATLRVQP